MGEYAKYKGESVKIGTCESMYYLRADQRFMVQAERGNVDPSSSDALSIRFRFPFPDEDKVEPGQFENYGRALAVHGLTAPVGVEHYKVQFVASAGYNVCLPCPEGPQVLELPLNGGKMSVDLKGLNIQRNGFSGAVKLVQQKLLADGRLVPVCECGGCGSAWRLEDPSDIEALVVAIRAEGDRLAHLHNVGIYRDQPMDGAVAFWHKIADRILRDAKLDSLSDPRD